MQYIIGVDGGATKTEAVAYSLEDQELAEGHSDFGNLNLDFNKAAKNIISAIEQCINNIQEQDRQGECLCIYLGIISSLITLPAINVLLSICLAPVQHLPKRTMV